MGRRRGRRGGRGRNRQNSAPIIGVISSLADPIAKLRAEQIAEGRRMMKAELVGARNGDQADS